MFQPTQDFNFSTLALTAAWSGKTSLREVTVSQKKNPTYEPEAHSK